jgi:hypothetical protein
MPSAVISNTSESMAGGSSAHVKRLPYVIFLEERRFCLRDHTAKALIELTFALFHPWDLGRNGHYLVAFHSTSAMVRIATSALGHSRPSAPASSINGLPLELRKRTSRFAYTQSVTANLPGGLHRMRTLVERFFNKIKQCRRVATRYDKLGANYLAFIQLASIRLWLRVNESTP